MNDLMITVVAITAALLLGVVFFNLIKASVFGFEPTIVNRIRYARKIRRWTNDGTIKWRTAPYSGNDTYSTKIKGVHMHFSTITGFLYTSTAQYPSGVSEEFVCIPRLEYAIRKSIGNTDENIRIARTALESLEA